MSLEEKKTNNFLRVLRIIFFNIVGFYAAYYIGGLAVMLASWLFVDVLGNMKLITALLSWPVEYGTYALTGIIFVDAAVTLNVCKFISSFGKGKYNYACFAIGLFRIISYISSAISSLSENGFNFSFIWTLLISLFGFVMFTLSTAANNDL